MKNNLPFYDKIPYTMVGKCFRPYLEVVFYDKTTKKTVKSLALVDSGADFTVIPFSIGNRMSLHRPSPLEFEEARGVAGGISLVSRKCMIYLLNNNENKIYGFNETIRWAYPDNAKQQKLIQLYKEYNTYTALKSKSQNLKTDYRLTLEQIEQIIKGKVKEINEIMNFYETSVLLGRSFFEKFEFIQFCQRDKKPFFTYKIKKEKVKEATTINKLKS